MSIAAICYISIINLALFGVCSIAKRSNGNTYFPKSGFTKVSKRLWNSADLTVKTPVVRGLMRGTFRYVSWIATIGIYNKDLTVIISNVYLDGEDLAQETIMALGQKRHKSVRPHRTFMMVWDRRPRR